MTKAIIGFSRPKTPGFGSTLIMLWQGGTPYSHVYLKVYSNYTEKWLVYQASHGDVHCLTYDNFLLQATVVDEITLEVSSETLKNTIKKAQDLLQTPYGYVGLIYLGLTKIVNKIAGKWVKIGDGLKSMHCSEFIGALFPYISVELKIDNDSLEPVDLKRYLDGQIST